MNRVLLVSHRGVAGGAQRALAELARHLPDVGWEPGAVVGEPGPLEDWLRAADVPVWRAGHEPWTPERAPAAVAAATRAARGHGATVVLGLCAEGHRIGSPAATALGLPAVWWQMLTPRGRPYEQAAAALPAAAVACQSAGAAARQSGPVEVLPLGIDVPAVRARRGCGRAVRARVAPDGPLVGIVGRLDPIKGQDDFLAAAARLPQDVRFAVVGGAIIGHEGDLGERLVAQARALGIDGRVTFTGHVEDAMPWIDALDVMVIASHHEALPLVVMEALALGVPIVATVTDGTTALLGAERLVPVRDPAALATAIARALDAPADPPGADACDVRVTARRMGALFERVSGGVSGSAAPAGAPVVPAGAA